MFIDEAAVCVQLPISAGSRRHWTQYWSIHLAGLKACLNYMSALSHLNLINGELKHGESRKGQRGKAHLSNATRYMWLTQSMGALHPPFSPQRFLPHPFCAPTHELPCFSLLKVLLTTSFNFILYSTRGSLPRCFTILQSETCLSNPVTPRVWSSLRSTFLSYLTAPQLFLLLFTHFKSQQKSWLRPPGLINIGTTNIPSLGTNWHRWAPAEVGDKLILWRSLPLKQFLVSWKDSLSILPLKKVHMSPSKGNQPAAVHISTVTPYRTSQTYSLCYVESIFSLWT